MSVLAAQGLAVGYGARRGRQLVLDGADLELRSGHLTCLLGANGSGKSTLLRTLVGLQPPLAGTVLLDGVPLGAMPPLDRARRLGVVLTEPVDAGLLRVGDLVALGRYPHTGWTGRLRPVDHDAIAWALRSTGADALAGRRVTELSDGERQRVLIARALAQQPTVLALDEPLAFVDVARRVELVTLLRHVAAECGLAVLMTTHDLELAVRTTDELWLVERTGGAPGAVHVGAPEDLVLDGIVERAFGGVGLRFDHTRGTFLPDRAPLALVRVDAEGPARIWAVRALEREGLREGGADATIRLTCTPAGRWRLRAPGIDAEHATLGAVIAALRARLPGLAADAVSPAAAEPAGSPRRPAADRSG